MASRGKRIGVDVGGSHVSACLVDFSLQKTEVSNFRRKPIDSKASASSIIDVIASSINEVASGTCVDSIGLAFPGPFDYSKGVSALTGVGGKFERTFGLHVKQALQDSTALKAPFAFANDAHCFAMGAYEYYQLQSKRTVFITLGTGFGSAFMEEGVLVYDHCGIPSTGTFYDQPFLDATAEDYISTRWFLSQYQKRTGHTVSSVKEIVDQDSEVTKEILEEFGSNLGKFLSNWLSRFNCEELVIGGNISKANGLFGCSLVRELKKTEPVANLIYCDDTDKCILMGAALLPSPVELDQNAESARSTTQPLLPLTLSKETNRYHVFPSHHSTRPVYAGFDSLAQGIAGEKTVIIDGYGGVLWEGFRKKLQQALQAYKKKVFWFDINSCLHDPVVIEKIIGSNLNGDDPVFGKKYEGALSTFFDGKKVELLKPDEDADLSIVYGTGAALSQWKGYLIYVDVPKNEIQYRMRAGSIFNLGAASTASHSQMYKRFYFVDWPALNKHKEQILPRVDCLVDEQRIDTITWMAGNDFRQSLNEMLTGPVRVRPWFEAGVWGGDWMKRHIDGINQNEINYAWSFELITPENGIVIEGRSNLLEVSFDFLLFCDSGKLLGKASRRFGKEFPIRFDFLDTFNGGNLSIQCHPRTEYIRENFGENFTQDETYYILDCVPAAKVYLGFQNDINPDEFRQALVDAQQNSTELPVEKFVQKLDAHKHDLFLIPNGTIHASGKNNLVLEISSTPYIFTFKMYDWQRPDLNGQPRPINIEHAFNNLYFDRRGDYVKEQLISAPLVESEWDRGRKVKLATHPEHFYTVDRYEFYQAVTIETRGQCHCCMLAEGSSIQVETKGGTSRFAYAETFIIPAAVETYTVYHASPDKAFLVVAYVKEDHC